MIVFYLLAACIQVQVPDPGQPPVQRVFKKLHVDRYAVVIDRTSDQGESHFEFELKMTTQAVGLKDPGTRVEATLLNLKSTFDGREAPFRRSFGAAPLYFMDTGFPTDLLLGTDNSTFLMPILSWYVPKKEDVHTESFTVPDTLFDNKIHVGGSGAFLAKGADQGEIKLSLTISVASQPDSAAVKDSDFESTARFQTKTGILLAADGEISVPSGTIKFRMKRR